MSIYVHLLEQINNKLTLTVNLILYLFSVNI